VIYQTLNASKFILKITTINNTEGYQSDSLLNGCSMENSMIKKARTCILLVYLVPIAHIKLETFQKRKKIISIYLSAATCNDQQLATEFKCWFTDYCIATLHEMAAGSESLINYSL
jgi:hypothetical protein